MSSKGGGINFGEIEKICRVFVFPFSIKRCPRNIKKNPQKVSPPPRPPQGRFPRSLLFICHLFLFVFVFFFFLFMPSHQENGPQTHQM